MPLKLAIRTIILRYARDATSNETTKHSDTPGEDLAISLKPNNIDINSSKNDRKVMASRGNTPSVA